MLGATVHRPRDVGVLAKFGQSTVTGGAAQEYRGPRPTGRLARGCVCRKHMFQSANGTCFWCGRGDG